MNLLLHIVHVFHIFIIFTVINGYILFAANIEDFKTIAKKYIPDRFVERLARIASDTSLFKNPNEAKNRERNVPIIYNMPMRVLARSGTENKTTDEDTSTILLNTDSPVRVASVNTENGDTVDTSIRSHKRKISVHDLDIDELVEKVKERLDKEYLDRYKDVIIKKLSAGHGREEVDNKRNINKQKRINLKQAPENDKMPMYDQRQYDDEMPQMVLRPQKGKSLVSGRPQIEERPEDHMPNAEAPQFDQVDMTKLKDSYEDYKAPPRDNDVLRESQKKDIEIPKKSNKRRPPLPDYESDHEYDYKIKSSELKAMTVNLNYDEHQAYDGNDGKSPQGLQGTVRPTRERYTMSSPNYYASIPIKAEKYDFNEPLPERDREQENIKYIGNPPAKINKKVLL